MQLITLTFYTFILAITFVLTIINLIYSYRLDISNYKLGLSIPGWLKLILRVNIIVLFTATIMLAVVVGNSLVSNSVFAFF
jgi:hypothetical protein